MKLQIIVGSTRPGRMSDRVARWVVHTAGEMAGIEAELVDLADYTLPFFDEPISPQYNPHRTPDEVVQRWLQKVAQADAYVLVTPEYNRSYPAVLKNALDYIDFQFAKKPVALVAHGVTGGSQAISHLRGVIPGLQAITVPNATYISGRVGDIFDESGVLKADIAAQPHGPQMALQRTLAEVQWYGEVLAAARQSAA
jgi:NAD(P)H-dependent FMN reductase